MSMPSTIPPGDFEGRRYLPFDLTLDQQARRIHADPDALRDLLIKDPTTFHRSLIKGRLLSTLDETPSTTELHSSNLPT